MIPAPLIEQTLTLIRDLEAQVKYNTAFSEADAETRLLMRSQALLQEREATVLMLQIIALLQVMTDQTQEDVMWDQIADRIFTDKDM